MTTQCPPLLHLQFLSIMQTVVSLTHHINRKVKANTLRRGTTGLKGLLEKVTGHRLCVPELQREAIPYVRLIDTTWWLTLLSVQYGIQIVLFLCVWNKDFSHQSLASGWKMIWRCHYKVWCVWLLWWLLCAAERHKRSESWWSLLHINKAASNL